MCIKTLLILLLIWSSSFTFAQENFFSQLADSAATLVNPNIIYDPAYRTIDYPGGGVTHIGIVVKRRSPDQQRHLIMHNIGGGQIIEDILFEYDIIGYYGYGR